LRSEFTIKSIEELENEGLITKIQDGNHGEIHPKLADFVSEGIPFVTARDLKDNFLHLETCNYISKKQADSLRIGFAESGDLLLTHKATMGRVAIVPEIKDYVMLSPQVTFYRINNEKMNISFLFYAFQDIFFQQQLQSFSDQTTRKYMGITEQRILEIRYTDLKTQNKICPILENIDNKITILKKQNSILEEIVNEIYHSYFVNFDGISEFKNSELGKIPKKWEVETLDEVVEKIIDHRGKTPKKLGTNWSKTGIPVLSAKNIKNGKIINHEKIRFVDDETYEKWMPEKIHDEDILLTSEAPLGETHYVQDMSSFCIGQRLFALRVNSNKIHSGYLYHYLNSEIGKNQLTSRGTGSTVDGIRQSELREINVLIPKSKQNQNFSVLSKTYFSLFSKNQKMIEKLSEIKKSLLPKLMSGEIKV